MCVPFKLRSVNCSGEVEQIESNYNDFMHIRGCQLTSNPPHPSSDLDLGLQRLLPSQPCLALPTPAIRRDNGLTCMFLGD